MSRKTVYFGLAALLILSGGIALIGGLGWGQKAPAGVGNLPVRDGSLEQGKTGPAVVNAKAHALISDFGRVPVFFVPNRGQTDDRVGFYVKGADKTIYFSPDGVTFALSYSATPRSKKEVRKLFEHISDARNELMDKELRRWTVKMDFLGARKDVKPEGLEKTGASISYFRGKPEEWKTGLPAYSKIIYRDLWPGIDLVYMGEFDKLKYDFVVHPGADPAKIRLAYRGAERVALTAEGRLEVKTPGGAFEDDFPLAYQELEGERRNVPVAYSVDAPTPGLNGRAYAYGFQLGDYDRSRILVLDPTVLVYCGYIGGASDQDYGYAIAVDGSGNAYVTGRAWSTEGSFPVTVGPDLTHNGNREAFVAKVNASGTGLVYCGYIGGANDDIGRGIAVDGSGNAYITGRTGSTEVTFPVSVGPDLTHNGGDDTFVAKVNSSGTALVYCGYIGGDGGDAGGAISVDDSGSAYVMGYTSSGETTFPVAVGPDLTYNGNTDIFVAKVDSSGTALVYCGYIGGDARDGSEAMFQGALGGIAVDSSGNAYVAGATNSGESTFPVTVGPDLTYNGAPGFVAKVNSNGTTLDYCGYIDSSDCRGIAIDDSGNAYVTGSAGPNLPVIVGPDLTFNGGDGEAFVAKVNASGTGLVYCGYIGGAEWDEGTGIAVDNSGRAYIVGYTKSPQSSFPVIDGPDLTYNSLVNGDTFVAEVNSSGAALVYCGYIGGENGDYGSGIAVDGSGSAYVIGSTWSSQATFPEIVGPDLTLNGPINAFVAKVSPAVVPGPPITSLLPDSADAGDPGLNLSVIGSEFVDGAVVRWDGNSRSTTFVSEFEVDATIDASDLVAGKTVQVTVRNPNGGISNSLPFTISNPLPSLASLSTTHVTGGGAAFTLTVQGSNSVPNSVVRWNGNNRTTTYVSATEVQGAILSTDIATGGEAQITVFNPSPAGGASGAMALQVSSFTLSASTASVTVTAGQSATYTIQLTPQYGSFDSAVSFGCVGAPSKCTATFSPTSLTPGAGNATTTLTLTTSATSSSTSTSLFGAIGFGPPTLGLLAFVMTLFLGNAIRKRVPWRLSRRWLAACALVCLVLAIGSCSAGGDGGNNYTGTQKGTHTISVQATSGNMTVPTSITLVVN